MEKIIVSSYYHVPLGFTGIVEIREVKKIKKKRYTSITLVYLKDGEYHREDGPAIIYYKSGWKNYCLNGNHCDTKEEWFEKLSSEQKVKAMMNLENFDE